MYARAMFFGALLGGLTLFLWGAVSHMAMPWAKTSVVPFPAGAAAIEQLHSVAPQNGVYYDGHGYFLAAAVRPDGKDKTTMMTPMLGAEFFTNLLCGMVLTGLLIAFRTRSLKRQALLGATMGLAASLDIHLSYLTWYGFSWAFTIPAILDVVLGWFLASIAIGWAISKFGPKGMPAAA